jgi:uncharacterized protein (DUF433 family)
MRDFAQAVSFDILRLAGKECWRRQVMMTITENYYVTADAKILGGEPIIKGTRTPVRAIVEIWRLGTPAEEIHKRLPHLKLAQVFSALSYYSDHQDEINAHIERNRIPEELLDPLVRNL